MSGRGVICSAERQMKTADKEVMIKANLILSSCRTVEFNCTGSRLLFCLLRN